MPQVIINSTNIDTFFFNATFDLLNRRVIFDTSGTTYSDISGSGILYVQGISFSLIDSDGVALATIDFTDAANYIVPSVTETFTIDLSSLSYAFLFQKYSIQAAIKDADDNIYYTTVVYKKVCEPVNFNESGYVPGLFQVTADCVNNTLTVQELTNFAYNNLDPESKTKDGTFYYPTGTISPITFANTPWSNNVVYTGQNRVVNTTIATYDLGDDIFVEVAYVTDNAFDITCTNKMSSIMCCLADLQATYNANCNNAKGQAAKDKLDSVLMPLLIGLSKEISGQDASLQADLIRKTLNCSCGEKTIKQNEATPINPSIYNIVLQGVGGTTVPSAVVVGNTKTYNIASNVYQVVKGNAGDLAYTITIDTATANTVKYKITFNYDIMAGYILTAIQNSPTYINLLNSLITSSGAVSMIGLDGKCVIDLSLVNYSTSQAVTGSTLITNIVINGTNYAAPANLFANNTVSVEAWLNSLTLGTFTAVLSLGVLTILSVNNTNVVSTITFTSPNVVKPFSATNKTLLQVLQAIVDYLCGLTALQVALAQNLQLCYFDYNGNVIYYNYATGNVQSEFNTGISSVICNIVSRINTLTSVTCASIAAVFADYPLSFLSSAGRLYGNDGVSCVAWTPQQIALSIINAINSYADVKSAFCAIDCSSPGTCPDISDSSLAMVGANTIGLYGVTWAVLPLATQTVTVRYKLSSSSTYLVATNSLQILANGNLAGTTPFTIPGVVAGSTYDVQVINSCGGVGFVKQITVPTGAVYSGSFLFDTIIYNICGDSPVTLYSSSPFAPGVIMYTNAGLTTPLTGYNYIADSTGAIYTIDSATGEVLVSTGSSCDNGTSGLYLLGNNTGTICDSAVLYILYTNGAFAVGGTLYNDSGLTSPVTGYSYVVNTANNQIYNLNTLTGEIGSITGLSCSVYGGVFVLSNSPSIPCDDPTTPLYSSAAFGVGVTMYSDTGLTTPVTGFQYILDATSGGVYTINPVSGVVGALSGNCTPP